MNARGSAPARSEAARQLPGAFAALAAPLAHPCINLCISDVDDVVMSGAHQRRSESNVVLSFSDFYRSELDGQVRRAALLTGSTEVANDIAHDAFTEVFRRWDQLDHPGAYLNRAVLNRCRDLARTRKRRGRLLSRITVDDASWDAEPIADLLDTLPFNHRAAVVLKFYVGLSNVEISEALDCPPGSVGPWLDRALKQLRKVML